MDISVIMAVYNQGKHLPEAVKSILDQTYRRFEFIIVNDGSTDSSKKILNEIEDRRVKVIHFSGNRGAANALNLAAERAKGKWLAVQDADDISLRERLQEQNAYIEAHPQIAAVGSLIDIIPGDFPGPAYPVKRLPAREVHWSNLFISAGQIKEARFYGAPLCHGSVIFSKKLFQRAGGYNTCYRVAYDYDLWMRLLRLSCIEKIPKVLYRWRDNPASLSRKDRVFTCNEVITVSIESICRECLACLKHKPKLAVFGPERGCRNFARLPAVQKNLLVSAIPDRRTEKELPRVLNSFRERQIDAAIVLESMQANQILKELLDGGMSYNQNLFKLWNILY